jgi:hypothetical protein
VKEVCRRAAVGKLSVRGVGDLIKVQNSEPGI